MVLDGIKPGKYTVQQIEPPESYILNDEVYSFEVTEDGLVINENKEEIDVIIKNDKEKVKDNVTDEEPKEEVKKEEENGNKVIEKDNDIQANKPIPHAGSASVKYVILITLTLLTIYFAIKLKKLRY